MRSSFTPHAFALATLLAATWAPSSTARAQGTLSGQGFGYPPGQMSTRVLGTGGAIAEFDNQSPLNPAALAIRTAGIEMHGQYDPELRTVKGPTGTSHTTTSRFSNFGAVIPLNRRLVIGASASTFLDRTWATESRRAQEITPGDTTFTNERLKSSGGISDLRFGVGYALSSRVRVGVAGHYFSGSNAVSLLQQFDDSLKFSNISQSTTLTFGGTAYSAGAEVDLARGISLAASGRLGREIRMSSHDTVITRGDIPDRYAVSVGYSGLPGTFVAVRYGVDKWKSMESLSASGATTPSSAGDLSIGVESAGPRSGNQSVVLRLGARFRTLPFQVSGASVRERSFGGGVGLPIAQGRATLDLALLRSSRTGVSQVTESAYNLSFGLRVHP